jgi:hypothetical protein
VTAPQCKHCLLRATRAPDSCRVPRAGLVAGGAAAARRAHLGKLRPQHSSARSAACGCHSVWPPGWTWPRVQAARPQLPDGHWQTYQHVVKRMQTDAAEKVSVLIFGAGAGG